MRVAYKIERAAFSVCDRQSRGNDNSGHQRHSILSHDFRFRSRYRYRPRKRGFPGSTSASTRYCLPPSAVSVTWHTFHRAYSPDFLMSPLLVQPLHTVTAINNIFLHHPIYTLPPSFSFPFLFSTSLLNLLQLACYYIAQTLLLTPRAGPCLPNSLTSH